MSRDDLENVERFDMKTSLDRLLQKNIARYSFSIAAVATAFALRLWLIPLTGTGASFVLFFAAILIISLSVGTGPGVLALVLSLPLAAYMFVVRGGYPGSQAAFQSVLFTVDGVVALYLTFLAKKGIDAVQGVNRRLRSANQAIAQSELRTREIIELAPDAFFLADLNARFTDVNQAACRMLGYKRDDLIGKTIFEIIPPEDAPRLNAVKARLLAPGEVDRAEWALKRADGTFVPVEVSANILPDGRWQAFVRDVSEARRVAIEREELLGRERLARRQAESANAQLRESEDRFRLTVDEAPIGMALVALDGRFVRVNRVLCEIVGYRPDELTTLAVHDITHPDDLDAGVALASQLARGEIPRYQLEKRFIRKDRSIVNVMLSASILRDRSGVPLYYISQIEDITERKRAEDALRLSEAKFSGIVAIAADAIILVDQDQQITIFNEGAESIFGYSRAEVVGRDLEMLIPERYREVHRQDLAQFAAGHETARRMGGRQDVFGLRKNGEEFPAEASISKVVVNNVTLFSVVLRDVTDRKKIETALRRAVTAREQVLGVVAHDLRNPLASIVQSADLTRRGPDRERRNTKLLDIISRAAARMNRLIQDLLDVSLIEAGQLKIEVERVSAADIVFEAVEVETPFASSAGVEIGVDLAGDGYDVWGNRDRLLEVFENVIGNAIKFTPPGGRVTVGAASRGQEILFWVTDTGSGIASDRLPHVFDRFWQAVPRMGRLGAGLGLPISKGIVEAHGGRMWVESTAGRGSSFFFTIPKASSDVDHPEQTVRALNL